MHTVYCTLYMRCISINVFVTHDYATHPISPIVTILQTPLTSFFRNISLKKGVEWLSLFSMIWKHIGLNLSFIHHLTLFQAKVRELSVEVQKISGEVQNDLPGWWATPLKIWSWFSFQSIVFSVFGFDQLGPVHMNPAGRGKLSSPQ